LKAVDDTAIVNSKEKVLLLELKKLNDFIEQRNTKFLSGNEMTLVDCDLMPKLQHIRIAGKVCVLRMDIDHHVLNPYITSVVLLI
jgi:hypothetical protein